MKRILVITVFVILLFPFQPVKAETGYLQDFKEYDSFQKAYNRHLSELIYYSGVSYDSNSHYFKENIELLHQTIDDNFDNTLINGILNTFVDGMAYFEKPISFLNASYDLRERLFGKIKDSFGTQVPNSDFVKPNDSTVTSTVWQYKGMCGERHRYDLNNDYVFKHKDNGSVDSRYTQVQFDSSSVYVWKNINGNCSDSLQMQLSGVAFKDNHLDGLVYFLNYMDRTYGLIVVRADSNEVVKPYIDEFPQQLSNIYNYVTNNYNEGNKLDEDYIPTVVPQLICPDETVDLQYADGSFYTKARQILLVQPDETVEFNGVVCDLDFKFPLLEVDDVTGELTADGESLINLDVLPVEPPDDFNYSLLGYIQNSYNYATSVVQTGVQGLKSIVIGTTGLVTFAGSMFGFLPPEILTLFIGGFSIALGLWVFKK